MQTKLTTPVAILFGSVIVAIGLYLGLRTKGRAPRQNERARTPDSAAARPPSPHRGPTTSHNPGPGTMPVARPRRPASPAQAATLEARVRADATRALEVKRAQLVRDCWVPSFRKNPKPARARYVFNLAFDATGREVGRGISETRGQARSDTAHCLRRQPIGLTIPPPGRRITVHVILILP